MLIHKMDFMLFANVIECLLDYFSVNPMFPLFLRLPGKMVLDPNGSYINTFNTKIRNVCLSSLMSEARLQPTPAYVEA